MLAACDANGEPVSRDPTLEPVSIVKRLATIAPTATPDTDDSEPDAPAPTLAPPTRTPTPTPYIGVFLGEAAVNPFAPVTRLDPAGAFVDVPTPERPFAVRVFCDIPHNELFGAGWREDTALVDELRCPIQIMFGFRGRVQIFEGGAMYSRPETGEVWAIQPGRGGEGGAYWYVGSAPEVGEVQFDDVPPGRIIPTEEIGAVWLTVPQVRGAMGFAIQNAFNGDINVQRFDGGSLFLDASSGQVFVLSLDGTAAGPYAGDLPEIGN
ncbi:MAG: hypothetical protein EA396_01245 [Anaerolineaceae bacterium]|nr:MAG: hypothetical protein EA396_01245 [Anaerolineaceae bacterium]